jgi:ABC-type multidrug transport system fused ATPase/permease subunit
LGLFVLLILSLLLFGIFHKKRLQSLPLPPEALGMTVSFENIQYTIDDKQVLGGISGEVQKGQILAIMGPSGKF